MKIEQPAIELDLDTAYISDRQITVHYKFITEESVLRCRYALNKAAEQILSGVSSLLTPGVLYEETFNIPEPYGEGNYLLHIVGQVERNGSFVDMASLSQTIGFNIDNTPPPRPAIGITDDWRYLVTDQISLDHDEWPPTTGSPVRLRYRFDGEPVLPEATEVLPQTGEIWIAFPSAVIGPGLHTLQAVAIDEAGNPPSAIESKQFYFLAIESAVNHSSGVSSAVIGDTVSIDISGYNFSTTDQVGLFDKDGTKAKTYAGPNFEGASLIHITVDLAQIDESEPGENSTIDEGEGYIKVTALTPNAISTTKRFDLIAQ